VEPPVEIPFKLKFACFTLNAFLFGWFAFVNPDKYWRQAEVCLAYANSNEAVILAVKGHSNMT